MTKMDRGGYALIIFAALFALIVGLGLTDYWVYDLEDWTYTDRGGNQLAYPEGTDEVRLNLTGAWHIELYTLMVIGATLSVYPLAQELVGKAAKSLKRMDQRDQRQENGE